MVVSEIPNTVVPNSLEKDYIFNFNDLVFYMGSNIVELKDMKTWKVTV